jgi:hypothetical protein
MAVVIPVISTFDSRGIDKAVKDFKKLQGAGEKGAFGLLSANKAVNSLGKSMAKFGGIAIGVSAVIGKSMVQSASTLQESISKVQAVFGDSSSAVIKWSDTTAKKLGISKSAALEAAGTYGNLFQAFGLAAPQAQEMSVRLVELAADMASFNNTSVDDAIRALSSGLSGETEPMKKYGSVLSDVRLKQEALDMKLIQTAKGTLPIAVKAQAAYSLILKDTAIQQGDVERTSGGLAFQIKSLGAQFEDVKAKIGTALIPVVTQLTTFINNNMLPVLTTFGELLGTQGLGTAFTYLAGSIVRGIAGMGTFGKIIIGVTVAVTALKTATITFTAVQGALLIATKVTTGALQAQIVALNATKVALMAAGGVTALLAIAATLYTAYAVIKSKAVKQTENFSEALYGEAKAQKEAVAQLAMSDPIFQDLLRLSTAYGLTVDDLSQFLNTGNGKFRDFSIILGVAAAQTGDLSQHTQMLGENIVNAAKAAGIQGQALDDVYFKLEALSKQGFATRTATEIVKGFGLTGSSAADAGGKVETAAEKFKKFADAANSVASQQRSVRDAVKGVADAQDNLTKATSGVIKAQKDFLNVTNGYGASSKQAAQAQKDLAAAQREATRAGFGLADAQRSVLDAQRKIADLTKAADPRTIQEAQDDLTEAQFRLVDAEEALNKARSEGTQREIVEAEIAVRDATNGVTDANKALAESQKLADPALLTQAQQELAAAELDVVEAEVAQKEATDNVATAQEILNQKINGAKEGTDAYKEALNQLEEAQKTERDAIDSLRSAKEREIETTKALVKANLLLQKSRKKLSKKQIKEAEKLVDKLQAPVSVPSPTSLPSIPAFDFGNFDFSGLDLSGIDFSGIGGLAKGGIVTKPTLTWVGEGGESEAVIPLSKLGNMGGDVYNITINSKIADATLPDVLVAELRKFNRRSGAINIQVA